MSKVIRQKQSLNLVIIIISALVLAFMLIGRFMERSVEQSNARDESRLKSDQQYAAMNNFESIQLNEIDFGLQSIRFRSLEKAKKTVMEWQVLPELSMSDETAEELATQWLNILQQPIEPSIKPQYNDLLAGATVLLYFAELSKPLVAKIALVSEQTPVNGDQQNSGIYSKISIRFVSTGQQIIIANLSLEQLLPENIAQKMLANNSLLLKKSSPLKK